jgi:hypothetical protein
LQFPEAYAYLFVNGSEVTIRRLGAGPELLVCGEPAETAELFHGDLIAFGPFELRVRITGPAISAAPHDEVESLLLEIRAGLAAECRNASEDISACTSAPASARSLAVGFPA